jgi:DNA-directed RNA polymerase specialized sigma24 family protein
MDLHTQEVDIKELYKLTKAAVRRSRQKVYRDFEDTVQEAMMFLLNNMKYYNPDKGGLATFVFSNVKRSMMNQVVYLNAKKRQHDSFLISLELPTKENHTIADNIASDTKVEYEVMWSSLMDKLTPLQQDIVRLWVGKKTSVPLQHKYNIPVHVLQKEKDTLKNKLKDELLLNF